MSKSLFFDAEDFMWADGKPLSPSEAAMQANKMFCKWYLEDLEEKIEMSKKLGAKNEETTTQENI